MPTATINPDLTPDQLLELDRRTEAAKQQRADRQRAALARQRQQRQARAKLAKVEAEITKLRTDQDTKLATVVMLRERLAGVEELNEHAPGVREERAALVDAIDMATEEGAPVVSHVSCPANLRSYRLLFDAAPHGTNWHTPLAELGRRLEALTAEQDRLRERLEELEEEATANAA